MKMDLNYKFSDQLIAKGLECDCGCQHIHKNLSAIPLCSH